MSMVPRVVYVSVAGRRRNAPMTVVLEYRYNATFAQFSDTRLRAIRQVRRRFDSIMSSLTDMCVRLTDAVCMAFGRLCRSRRA